VFVYINSTAKEVDVWRRTNTGWEVADFTDCIYSWKFADYYGNAINFNGVVPSILQLKLVMFQSVALVCQ
jgi:hypothetical protein